MFKRYAIVAFIIALSGSVHAATISIEAPGVFPLSEIARAGMNLTTMELDLQNTFLQVPQETTSGCFQATYAPRFIVGARSYSAYLGSRVNDDNTNLLAWRLNQPITLPSLDSAYWVASFSNNCTTSPLEVIGQTARSDGTIVRQTITVPGRYYCSATFNDKIDLGTFTAASIVAGARSNSKINLDIECDHSFSLTFSGIATDTRDFRLGEDVAMKLSYNNGADRIINGQAFTPALSQIIDIDVAALTPGVTPVAGIKSATLTVTINVL